LNTVRYLTDLGGVYGPSVVAALAIGATGGLVSVLVVLKRLAFVGQGVSHAAFGGVGLALAIGSAMGTTIGAGATASIVLVFAVGAAIGIARLGRIAHARADTAIGIVLAASMATGFVLYGVASRHAPPGATLPGIESVLFGDILAARWGGAALSVAILALVLVAVWSMRRGLIMWGFDEAGAEVMGVRTRRVSSVFMGVLAVAIVGAVQLAGVVLATAVFVLPGAAALRLSSRLVPVLAWSVALGVLGAALGIVLGFELDWAIGPSIVLAQCSLLGLCVLAGRAARSG